MNDKNANLITAAATEIFENTFFTEHLVHSTSWSYSTW